MQTTLMPLVCASEIMHHRRALWILSLGLLTLILGVVLIGITS